MTVEELLKPRYKVIGPYPFSPYKVGDLLNTSKHGSFHITTTNYRDEFGERQGCENYHPEKEVQDYPNLFRKIGFWEKREGPLYVKYEGEVYCVEFPEWSSSNEFGYYKSEKNHGWGGGVLHLPECEPATEEEINNYKIKHNVEM